MYTFLQCLNKRKTIRSLKSTSTIVKNTAKNTNKSVIDFLFPPVCLNCHSPLQNPNLICSECWQNIDFLIEPLCQINGTPFPFAIEGETVSVEALQSPPEYNQARGVATYEGTMRELIHKLKYQDRHELTNLLVNWMKFSGKDLLSQTDIILPIPLYRWRLWQRKFNQSALLASRLGEISDLPCDCTVLLRQKKTLSQVGLSSKERYKNLNNAFLIEEIKRIDIKNKRILLIDDVITTGATINSATKVLITAGAKSVNVLSLAIVTNDQNRLLL